MAFIELDSFAVALFMQFANSPAEKELVIRTEKPNAKGDVWCTVAQRQKNGNIRLVNMTLDYFKEHSVHVQS